jgi:hypothetical protein
VPPDPELSYLLGQTRELVARFKAGGAEAPGAFCDFVALILGRTILDPTSAIVLQYGPRGRDSVIIGGRSNQPLRLQNGYFLRVTVSLFYDRATTWWKVTESSFQYQADETHDRRWIFRYDYARNPDDPYPAAHLHVRGASPEPYRDDGSTALDRLHFPTGRICIEAVIRLLVESFGVPCPDWENWRRVLGESERSFLEMAHRPSFGPTS